MKTEHIGSRVIYTSTPTKFPGVRSILRRFVIGLQRKLPNDMRIGREMTLEDLKIYELVLLAAKKSKKSE